MGGQDWAPQRGYRLIRKPRCHQWVAWWELQCWMAAQPQLWGNTHTWQLPLWSRRWVMYVIYWSSIMAKHLTVERTQLPPKPQFTADTLNIYPKTKSQSHTGVVNILPWATAPGVTLQQSSRSVNMTLTYLLISIIWSYFRRAPAIWTLRKHQNLDLDYISEIRSNNWHLSMK